MIKLINSFNKSTKILKTQSIIKPLSSTLEILIAISIWSVIRVNFELYEPLRTGKFLFLGWSTTGVCAVFLLLLFIQRKMHFTYLSLVLFLFAAYVFIRGKKGGIWHDEKFLYLIASFIIFLAVSQIIAFREKRTAQNLPFILLSILIAGGYQAILGLFQLYGLENSYHGGFNITGTFFNPAPYAGFLTAVFPIALYQLLVLPKKTPKDLVSIWI